MTTATHPTVRLTDCAHIDMPAQVDAALAAAGYDEYTMSGDFLLAPKDRTNSLGEADAVSDVARAAVAAFRPQYRPEGVGRLVAEAVHGAGRKAGGGDAEVWETDPGDGYHPAPYVVLYRWLPTDRCDRYALAATWEEAQQLATYGDYLEASPIEATA